MHLAMCKGKRHYVSMSARCPSYCGHDNMHALCWNDETATLLYLTLSLIIIFASTLWGMTGQSLLCFQLRLWHLQQRGAMPVSYSSLNARQHSAPAAQTTILLAAQPCPHLAVLLKPIAKLL